ncbi:receptor-like serine/threonine-protein kinase SD1-7 isoform X1 [Zingiber officinale]|uniref:receptor-like serine/threonine-protein kinase SD1-7 isoform X1 n=2 Tax=Zingiber officinale TaxID=94328 RepID=UPI001C4B9C2C|nr:receptor-like serine/threonine-protein kinase SD1-7 isoform X1 [Zingiber officinale]
MKLFLFHFLEIVAVTVFFLAQSSASSDTGDTMIQNLSLVNGQTLTSTGELFQLGFFSLDNSLAMGYLGIWYCDLTPQEGTVVWIANRNNSVNTSMASFNLTSDGNLILFEEDRIVWSTGTRSTGLNSTHLQLLESGNLVLNDSNSILWQSFEDSNDIGTYLPGMKLGFDNRTNTSWQQVSWKNLTDPSPGDYIHVILAQPIPDLFTLHRSAKYYRSGLWNGNGLIGHPSMVRRQVASSVSFTFVLNQNETYYMANYTTSPTPVLSRSVLCVNGTFQRWFLETGGKGEWQLLWSFPEDDCDIYNHCGRNSVCTKSYDGVYCQCLDGFVKIAENGCQREKPLNYSSNNQFSKAQNMKVPDTENATPRGKMSLDDCKNLCLSDSSRVAYAVISGSYGCITWPGDLLDLRTLDDGGGEDLYIRLAESSTKKQAWVAIVIPLLLGFFLLCCVGGVLVWRKRNRASTRLLLQLPNIKEGDSMSTRDDVSESRSIAIDSEDSRLHNTDKGVGMINTLGLLPSYDLGTIKTATNNFSDRNKLGEGGFGVVYMGQLEDGQKIAVKKLSRNSSQGPNEFQNELSLIAKLQHRNLVRLLGCCIEDMERIIILEYMENKSLDAFIYANHMKMTQDKTKSSLLNWQKRLEVIIGIARGLLYLHQDSILRVIHRDLKPSNILLDKDMIPKISDFGIARIFEGDRALEDETNRPIGTFGYMAPEYLLYGQFSFKSDVFSFGVIVLEILSGKRNRTFGQTNSNLNLLQHAYKLWKEGRSLEILDDVVNCPYPTIEILRCIRMALLCVQDNYEDRPTMTEVVMMLASDEQLLTPLKQPTITSTYSEGDCSTKEMSITITGR